MLGKKTIPFKPIQSIFNFLSFYIIRKGWGQRVKKLNELEIQFYTIRLNKLVLLSRTTHCSIIQPRNCFQRYLFKPVFRVPNLHFNRQSLLCLAEYRSIFGPFTEQHKTSPMISEFVQFVYD